jgi:hypothetical protein
MTAGRRAEGLTQRVSAWIARRQQEFSDHLHADGDAFANEHGWTITTTTGRFGFGGRVYRDPRFDQLTVNAPCGAPPGPDAWGAQPRVQREPEAD